MSKVFGAKPAAPCMPLQPVRLAPPTRSSPNAAHGTGRRTRRRSIRSARGPHGRLRKRAEGLLGQHRVAIFPDLLDLAVLEPKHETVVVVVAYAFGRDVVALGF